MINVPIPKPFYRKSKANLCQLLLLVQCAVQQRWLWCPCTGTCTAANHFGWYGAGGAGSAGWKQLHTVVAIVESVVGILLAV